MTDYTSPNFATAALITIDTQCDTLDGQPLEVAGTSAILPNLQALLKAMRAAGRPIIHIVRIYKADGSNVDLCRRQLVEEGKPLMLEGSAGCELAPAILPTPQARLDPTLLLAGGVQTLATNEVAIYKPRWGAFYQTPLHDYLQKLQVTTLLFSGCNFPNCPRTSIYEASERDYRVALVEDAVSGLYDRGRTELNNIGVSLLTTQAVIEKLQANRLPAQA